LPTWVSRVQIPSPALDQCDRALAVFRSACVIAENAMPARYST
jgi:hypothetical protein